MIGRKKGTVAVLGLLCSLASMHPAAAQLRRDGRPVHWYGHQRCQMLFDQWQDWKDLANKLQTDEAHTQAVNTAEDTINEYRYNCH